MNDSQSLMKANSECGRGDRRVDLQTHQIAELQNGKGVRVRVLSGDVWLTQHRDLRDRVLSKGDGFTVERNGLTLFYALEPAQLCVDGSASRRAVPWWKTLAQAANNFYARFGMHRTVSRGVYRL